MLPTPRRPNRTMDEPIAGQDTVIVTRKGRATFAPVLDGGNALHADRAKAVRPRTVGCPKVSPPLSPARRHGMKTRVDRLHPGVISAPPSDGTPWHRNSPVVQASPATTLTRARPTRVQQDRRRRPRAYKPGAVRVGPCRLRFASRSDQLPRRRYQPSVVK